MVKHGWTMLNSQTNPWRNSNNRMDNDNRQQDSAANIPKLQLSDQERFRPLPSGCNPGIGKCPRCRRYKPGGTSFQESFRQKAWMIYCMSLFSLLRLLLYVKMNPVRVKLTSLYMNCFIGPCPWRTHWYTSATPLHRPVPSKGHQKKQQPSHPAAETPASPPSHTLLTKPRFRCASRLLESARL